MVNVSTQCRWNFTLVVLAAATTAWLCTQASAEEALFANDEVMEISIRGPLRRLARSTPASTGFAGRLELENGTTIEMVFSKYGLSRLEECDLPLLKIEIDDADARGTLFEGHSIVRLVTPCHYDSTYDRFILLEYLAYRSYQVITEPALQTRLVSTRFLDSDRPAFEKKGLSFFIEDIEAAAQRYGMRWLDIEAQQIEKLDLSQLTVIALFQFMVGNTDWSAVAAAGGERCCHNVAVLGEEDDAIATLLPFDFDYSGLVNAPYAEPSAQLPIRRVTQRLYRGFCAGNDHLPAAIAIFKHKRPDLEWLFLDDGLPDPKTRARAWKYVESFYDTINDPQKVKSRILEDCR